MYNREKFIYLFVCLNALIYGITNYIIKILFILFSLFIQEAYRLCNIKLRTLQTEQLFINKIREWRNYGYV